MMMNQKFLDKQKRIEAKIYRRSAHSKHATEVKEQKEVAQVASASDPAEFSSSNLHADNNLAESRSSIMQHSQSDMMLSSAVKLASESSFKGESAKALGVKKKKKKTKKRKAVPVEDRFVETAPPLK